MPEDSLVTTEAFDMLFAPTNLIPNGLVPLVSTQLSIIGDSAVSQTAST